VKKFLYVFFGLLSISIVSFATVYYVRAASNGLTGTGTGHRQSIANNSGLVGWWKFDGHLSDSGNNQYDGTAIGTPTYSSGQFGKAVTFDGSTSYTSVGATSAANGITSYSVSAWVNLASSTVTEQFVFARGSSNTYNGQLYLYVNAHEINLDVESVNTAHVTASSSAVIINTNTWYYVTATVDGSNAYIYVNGVLNSTTALSGGATALMTAGTAYDNQTTIGAQTFSSFTPQNMLNGSIDDVRFYSRTLSQAEITQLYSGTSPTNCDQTCIGYWKLDEQGGNTARDSSLGSGINLTDNANTPSGTGKVGKDAVFTAASSQDFNTSTTASTNLSPGTTDLSFSMWLNFTSFPGSGLQYVLFNGASGNSDPGYDLRVIPGSELEILLGDGTSRQFCTSAALSTSTWYNVVVTMSRAGNMVMYINGSSSCSVSISGYNGENIIHSTSAFNLGGVGIAAEYIDSAMDEVAVWQRALSTTEVTDIYNSGSGKSLGGLTNAETQGLTAYWSMDEASGGGGLVQRNDSYAGIGKLSGFAFTPGTDGWAASVFGNGLQFASANSDYIDLGATSATNITGTQSFSISAWIKTSSSSGMILAKFNQGVAGNYFFGVSGSKIFGGRNAGGSNIVGNTSVNTGNWTLATLTYDGSNLRVYANGVSDATPVSNAGSITGSSTLDTLIGAEYISSSVSNFFNGTLDDVRFYNRALQSYEIYDQYLAGRS